ncbi:uncharacterized protein LOC114362714 [Ostrinia furnacalis]|uniref:uncharacterized protein LOC114362714 n=1 Tax=Ostrinia furnacalis TaxID=93504 RepID=UPI00103B407B|nr:uncharacterized protein LOC114362714 [Ostrinia furnacalis]
MKLLFLYVFAMCFVGSWCDDFIKEYCFHDNIPIRFNRWEECCHLFFLKTSETSEPMESSKTPSCPEHQVTSYVTSYILGFIILILVIIIIILAVMLYRNRKKDHKIFSPSNQPQPATDISDLNRCLKTQASHEMTILKMDSIPDVPVNQAQEEYIENVEDKLTTSTNSNLKRITANRHTGLGKDFKVYRSVKRATDQQMILKDQMKKICDDALARAHINGMSASLKDLNSLLELNYNITSPEHRVSKSREKSASYNELDVYDNTPSNIPVTEMAGEAVYDCLPSSYTKNNIVVEDFDTKYLLTISKENLTEPEYINAQYRYNKF